MPEGWESEAAAIMQGLDSGDNIEAGFHLKKLYDGWIAAGFSEDEATTIAAKLLVVGSHLRRESGE